MDLETIVKRIDEIEKKNQAYDKHFKNLGEQISNLENKIMGLPSDYRELKDDVSQLKKAISALGNTDKAFTQIRKDTIDKLGDLEKRMLKQQEQQTKVTQSDLQSISGKVDRFDAKMNSELDKKLQRYMEEDSRLLATVEKIEQSVTIKLKSDEDIRRNIEIHHRDIQNMSKRLEIIENDLPHYSKQQGEIQGKLSVFSDDQKQMDKQFQELKASETQRKLAFGAFIEQQEILQKDRESQFEEIHQKATNEIQEITAMREKMLQKEKELGQIGSNLDEVTKSYERRLKEVTELYQLFETKYQKEWSAFKNDVDKNWSNFSLINEEKQGAFTSRMDDMKSRMMALEDQTQDVQELLGLMSAEIQKGMLSLMKMANNWKDAFDSIQGK